MTATLADSAAARPTPRGFTLRVPPSWFEIDVWRATRTGDVRRLVDARVAADPGLAGHRGVLIRLLREVAERAERQGAVFCAAMADPVAGGTLAATLLVFHSEGSPDPAANTVEAIAGQIYARAPHAGSARHVELVELAAGRAVRVHGVEDADLGDGARLPCVVGQTLLPVPGGAGVVSVVLSSPQVELAEPMLELFTAITSTFAWSPVADEQARPDLALAAGPEVTVGRGSPDHGR